MEIEYVKPLSDKRFFKLFIKIKTLIWRDNELQLKYGLDMRFVNPSDRLLK